MSTMTTAEFYIVYIKRKKDVTLDAVQKEMNHALDWYRLDPAVWVLYTTSDAEKWLARLSPLVKDSGRVFICKLDANKRQGWMDNGFWKWMRREQDEK